MKESGICRLAGRPSAQHRRFLSASHARRAGTRERSSRSHRYLLRSPIRKNRPLRLSLFRISAGISPLFFRPHFLVEEHRCFRFPFRFTAGRDASFFRFSLSSVETHRFLTICRKILFLNKKKVHRISSVDNVDNYTLFIKSRFYPANVIIFTMTGCK